MHSDAALARCKQQRSCKRGQGTVRAQLRSRVGAGRVLHLRTCMDVRRAKFSAGKQELRGGLDGRAFTWTLLLQVTELQLRDDVLEATPGLLMPLVNWGVEPGVPDEGG
jgi:hypothetical protein